MVAALARRVRFGTPTPLRAGRVEIVASTLDPIPELLPRGNAILEASWGVEVPLGFTVDDASEVVEGWSLERDAGPAPLRQQRALSVAE